MTTDDVFQRALLRVVGGETLGQQDSARAFDAVMSGAVPDVSIAAFLAVLALRKPTVEEIAGAVRAMRRNMRKVQAPEGAIDLCGTGGDGHRTLNVSTAASFVVAGCGVPVAKHGNRNMSSRTGAADALEALGVAIELSPAQAETCLREAGLCFLFAQAYHPAMKHVAGVRRTLGFRTVFNLLGPLSNPAGVKRQLLGVFAEEWIEPVAQVLALLGADRVWVVHGSDGLDELSTTAPTAVAIVENGAVTRREVKASDIGLATATLAQLKGGAADENARSIRQLLDGSEGPYRDIVLLNSAAALVVAGRADDLAQGAVLAARSIDSGEAKRALERLIVVSNA